MSSTSFSRIWLRYAVKKKKEKKKKKKERGIIGLYDGLKLQIVHLKLIQISLRLV
jgi:hypothetical protein